MANSKGLYNGYLTKLQEAFDSAFKDIAAVYNFDHGDEFEIALCVVLRKILPRRFGVCRGFVVDVEGNTAGDDIIIYDQDRFPTLRLFDPDDHARKQQVPIEAVYAYIEAKHTLHLEGDGGQSVARASVQVAKVKELVGRRPAMGYGQDNPYLLRGDFRVVVPPGWPDRANPLYTVIWARQVKKTTGSAALLEGGQIAEALDGSSMDVKPDLEPDLIVCGRDVVIVPAITNADGTNGLMPFFVNGHSTAFFWRTAGLGHAAAVVSLLHALDQITLGKMPWPALIAHGLGANVH